MGVDGATRFWWRHEGHPDIRAALDALASDRPADLAALFASGPQAIWPLMQSEAFLAGVADLDLRIYACVKDDADRAIEITLAAISDPTFSTRAAAAYQHGELDHFEWTAGAQKRLRNSGLSLIENLISQSSEASRFAAQILDHVAVRRLESGDDDLLARGVERRTWERLAELGVPVPPASGEQLARFEVARQRAASAHAEARRQAERESQRRADAAEFFAFETMRKQNKDAAGCVTFVLGSIVVLFLACLGVLL